MSRRTCNTNSSVFPTLGMPTSKNRWLVYIEMGREKYFSCCAHQNHDARRMRHRISPRSPNVQGMQRRHKVCRHIPYWNLPTPLAVTVLRRRVAAAALSMWLRARMGYRNIRGHCLATNLIDTVHGRGSHTGIVHLGTNVVARSSAVAPVEMGIGLATVWLPPDFCARAGHRNCLLR